VYGTSRLSPRTREFLVDESQRIGVSRAAHHVGTSRRTVYRWRRRSSYLDRSSRPHRSPRRIADATEATVLALRVERRWGPDRIGPYLGMPASTVHRILRRHQAHRLSHLFPKPPRSFGRFDVHEPGELMAVDVKSFGSLARGGGKRGRDIPQRGIHAGWQHLHVAIDVASRLVFTQLRSGLGAADTTAFLADALSFFDARGIRVRRVLSDNGAGYKRSFDLACLRAGIRHTRTRPYHPWTNGRVERVIGTLQRECVYAGQRFTSDEERALAIWLYLAYYNGERPHTRLDGLPPLDWLAQWRVTKVCGDLS